MLFYLNSKLYISALYIINYCYHTLQKACISQKVMRSLNLRTDITMAKGNKTKEQTIIYKTLYRILKMKQHESH